MAIIKHFKKIANLHFNRESRIVIGYVLRSIARPYFYNKACLLTYGKYVCF